MQDKNFFQPFKAIKKINRNNQFLGDSSTIIPINKDNDDDKNFIGSSIDKKRLAIFLLFIFLTCFSGISKLYSQNEFRKINNEAFKPGERLQWRFYYDAWLTGKITAGIGITEVKETEKTFNGRHVWHIDSEGKSKGLFNWFYKVRDEFDSFVDKEFLAPHYFIRRTRTNK